MMQQLQLTTYVDIHCHDIWRKPKEASFYANGGDKLLHPRNIPNQAICKHFTSCLLSFTVCQISFCSSTIPKISLKHAC